MAPVTPARAVLLLLFLAAFPWHVLAAVPPGDPNGLWLTQDRGGIIAVSGCGKRLCLQVAGVVLDRPTDPMPLDFQGRSQCGLELVRDAAPVKPNQWRGHILDPRNGTVWGVQITLHPDGTLALRGYAGITLLGRTETWTRFPGSVPTDCRMSPSEVATAMQR